MGRKNPRYTREFREEAVRLYKESGKSLSAAAKDIGVAPSTLAKWTAQVEVDVGKGPGGALKSDERAELIRLRRENRQLTQERDFLKKATAFFVKENSPSRTR